MKNEKDIIAIFDFDGTITKGDTFLPFLMHTFGKWYTLIGLIRTFHYIIGYLIKIISNEYAKKKIIAYFFLGKDVTSIQNLSNKFINEKLEPLLRPNMINRINWHKDLGHQIVLVSASLNIYVEPWARKYNFDFIESTNLRQLDGVFTGEIVGKNCYGSEKVERLKNNICNDIFTKYVTYGYGDSDGDKKFLKKCNYNYYNQELNKV